MITTSRPGPRVQVYRNRHGMWQVGCACSLHMLVRPQAAADFFIWTNAIAYAQRIARQHR